MVTASNSKTTPKTSWARRLKFCNIIVYNSKNSLHLKTLLVFVERLSNLSADQKSDFLHDADNQRLVGIAMILVIYSLTLLVV